MKIALVAPPVDFRFHILPPLGLLSISSYIRWDHDVEVIDCIKLGIGPEDAVGLLADADIIGVSSNWSCNVLNTATLVSLVKERYPDKTVVCGGMHATFAPQALLDAGCDAVALGEAEETFRELVGAVGAGRSLSSVPGLALRGRDGCVITGKRQRIRDLDEMPMPSWDLVGTTYPSPVGRMSILETSRGCIHRCTFCSSSSFWDFTWRGKSPERVVDEFAYLSAAGTDFIFTADDCATSDPERLATICRRLIEEGNEVGWWSSARADVLARRPELASLMARAGCRIAGVGHESASQSILDQCRKGITEEMNDKAIKVLRDNGIMSGGTVIIGFPGESEESMRSSVELAMELDFPGICILRPYPGTEYENPAMSPEDYAKLNLGCSLLHEEPELVELIQKAGALQIYLRPRTLKQLASRDPFVRGWAAMTYRELTSMLLARVRLGLRSL
ncbi:MAG: radical SAM protein [Candidatus Undinarchaeales archaeon]|jgi:radical SAM superfamily enzyme YgiQ (UPF0313 family)|nr:radical SAM protein [Candidatus Undinarchaeales archaeon]MDP7491471.1 radical SAM protein [Candidatus Undinarchaeales archaeon]